MTAFCIDNAGNFKLNNASYGNQRNFQQLVSYVNGLFAIHSRLVIIRLDLKYNADFSSQTDLQQAQTDFSRFYGNMRNNSLFNDMVGYIWKLEEGEQGGYHYHCVFFFTNAHMLNHSYYGEVIGQYWQNVITKGRGSYFNCNRADYINRLSTPAIGVINHYDEEKRLGLIHIVAYLCKDEQSLANKPFKTRVMGRGQLPVRAVPLGRPRVYEGY